MLMLPGNRLPKVSKGICSRNWLIGRLADDACPRPNLPKARIMETPLRPLAATVLNSPLPVNCNFGSPSYRVPCLAWRDTTATLQVPETISLVLCKRLSEEPFWHPDAVARIESDSLGQIDRDFLRSTGPADIDAPGIGPVGVAPGTPMASWTVSPPYRKFAGLLHLASDEIGPVIQHLDRNLGIIEIAIAQTGGDIVLVTTVTPIAGTARSAAYRSSPLLRPQIPPRIHSPKDQDPDLVTRTELIVIARQVRRTGGARRRRGGSAAVGVQIKGGGITGAAQLQHQEPGQTDCE